MEEIAMSKDEIKKIDKNTLYKKMKHPWLHFLASYPATTVIKTGFFTLIGNKQKASDTLKEAMRKKDKESSSQSADDPMQSRSVAKRGR